MDKERVRPYAQLEHVLRLAQQLGLEEGYASLRYENWEKSYCSTVK